MKRAALIPGLFLGLLLGLTAYVMSSRLHGLNAQTYNPGGSLLPGKGGDLASAATITPTNIFHDVTGTTTINTITAPAQIQAGQTLLLRPKGLFSISTAGNVQIAITAVVDQVIVLLWDGTKWNPTSGGSASKSGTKGSQPAANTVEPGTIWLSTNDYTIERSNGSAWSKWKLGGQLTPPVNADFSWVNETSDGGTATVVQNETGIYFVYPTHTSPTHESRLRVKTAPATPYNLDAILWDMMHMEDTQNGGLGVIVRESATGKFMSFGVELESTNRKTKVLKWTDVNSPANFVLFHTGSFPPIRVFRIRDDGTNLIFSISPDGFNFLTFATEGRTAFMAGGPNQVGFYGHGNVTTGANRPNLGLTIPHFVTQ